MGGSFSWPVTLECGDLVLRPIRYRDRKEWTEVRSRNSEWLAPWEASNPAPGGGLPDYRQMVRSLNAQAAQATALPFLITSRTPGFREPVIVGQLTVSSIVWGSAMMATLGYWVDKDRAGQGIAPTAVAMATDYCFRTLGLHRMEINIRPGKRAQPAGGGEARLPRRGLPAAVPAHQRRMGGPPDLRADRPRKFRKGCWRGGYRTGPPDAVRPCPDQHRRHQSIHLTLAPRHTGDNAARRPALLIRF